MMLAGFLFLLLFTGGSASNHSEHLDDQQKSNHSFEQSVYQRPQQPQQTDSKCERDGFIRPTLPRDHDCMYNLSQYLNFNDEMRTLGRPVENYTSPLTVSLSVLLYAILDVNDKEQKFVSRIRMSMKWKNDYINWDSSQFCDIRRISLPTEVLWKPDIIIKEMTEKDKAPRSPYLYLYSNGDILLKKEMVVVSSCRMQVYKFPFDVQSCNLTFKSLIHHVGEIKLEQYMSSSKATEVSHRKMQIQSEWLFINITISNTTRRKSIMVYTINMKRRPALYIANFILPILFFLCLDLSSFLISDSGGEKLSFKVTVLLAVTVMQLILNEVLPSSSDRIPLIAIFCIGIFGLMMFSLMETIVVMYLLEKDNEAEKDQSLSKDCGDKCCRAKEASSSQLTESHDTDESSEAVKTQTLLHHSRKEEGKRGYWTRVAKTINKVFFIFYVIAASVFLFCMLFSWSSGENDSDDDSDD